MVTTQCKPSLIAKRQEKRVSGFLPSPQGKGPNLKARKVDDGTEQQIHTQRVVFIDHGTVESGSNRGSPESGTKRQMGRKSQKRRSIVGGKRNTATPTPAN